MKKIYLGLIILFKLIFPEMVFSQSDVKLSSFFLSPITYNPAYSGSFEGMTFTSIYSTQWVGFEGAPKTLFLNGHGTVFGRNTGLGLEIVHDEIGVTSNTNIIGNYAYKVQLSDKFRLALGIKAGFSWYSVDYERLNIENPFENNGLENISKVNPNIGAGFILHSDNFFIGVGVPNLFSPDYFDSFNNKISNSSQNFYFSAGYRFYLQNDIYLRTSVLSRAVAGAPINTLLAGILDFQDQFYFSLNVDLNTSVGGFAGIRFKETFLAGYSYDSSINGFSNKNGGIHSFFINYRLKDFWQRERCSCYNF